MNKKTYEKLKANPFFKPSPKILKEMEQFEKDQKNNPLVTFGVPPIHPPLEKKGY